MNASHPCQVLIVDDEPSICWALEKLMVGLGHSPRSCSSVEEAWKVVGIDSEASVEEPVAVDLILLDVRLPGMDGISALPRFAERFAGVPVIVMTAFGDLETAVSAIQAGATDYITKPFSLDEVERVCTNALQAKATREELDEAADTSGD
ncbi:MAG: response regulator, partial [Planctomycetota bacterium]